MKLEITLEQAQTIVDALSKLPYSEVHELIPSIINQANTIIREEAPEEGK